VIKGRAAEGFSWERTLRKRRAEKERSTPEEPEGSDCGIQVSGACWGGLGVRQEKESLIPWCKRGRRAERIEKPS